MKFQSLGYLLPTSPPQPGPLSVSYNYGDSVSVSSTQVTTNHLSDPPLFVHVRFCWLRSLTYSLILLALGLSWLVFFLCCLSVHFPSALSFSPKLAIDPLSLYLLLKWKRKRIWLAQVNPHHPFWVVVFFGLKETICHFSTYRLANLARGTNNLFTARRHMQESIEGLFLMWVQWMSSFLKKELWVFILKTSVLSAMSFGGK